MSENNKRLAYRLMFHVTIEKLQAMVYYLFGLMDWTSLIDTFEKQSMEKFEFQIVRKEFGIVDSQLRFLRFEVLYPTKETLKHDSDIWVLTLLRSLWDFPLRVRLDRWMQQIWFHQMHPKECHRLLYSSRSVERCLSK